MRWVFLVLLVALLAPASAAAQPRLTHDIYGYALTLDGVDDNLAVRSQPSAIEFAPSGATATLWSLPANCAQDQQTYVVRCPADQAPLAINAGAGADKIDASSSPVLVNLDGGAGPDTLTGSPGDDRITARDGEADSVDCGPGANDSVSADANDALANCENVSLPPPQQQPPSQHPPSGGEPAGSSPAPATTAPAPRVDASVRSSFTLSSIFTRVKTLSVSGAPSSSSIRLTCKGKDCPKTTTRPGPAASFKTLFKKRKLRAGTLLELRITAPGRTGRVVRFTMRRHKAPQKVVLCVPPGASKPSGCG